MPSRPGQQQAQQAAATDSAAATTANTNAQADLTQATQDQTNLRAGKNVGANPYLNPTYLAAVNRLRSGSLDQATNAGDQQIRALNARTGGMNSTASTGEIGKLALDKARLGSQLGAEQTAGDWTKNIGYQLNLAQQPLQSAAEQAKLYGTATQGQDSSIGNLTQFGLASYGPWMSAISALGGAGAAALKGPFGGGGGSGPSLANSMSG